MTILVTPDEMRAVERATIAGGRSAAELMRAAGEGIAAWIERAIAQHIHRPRRALGLIGPGNNGGDALVAMSVLSSAGWECASLFVSRGETGSLPADQSQLTKIPVLSYDAALAWGPDVVLDGIYGIGGRASLTVESARAIAIGRVHRETGRTVLVAVDLPSGIDGGTGAAANGAFPADVTLCLGLPKLGLIREPAASCVGELVVLDIGLEVPNWGDHVVMLDESQARALAPRRRASAHKIDAGATLIIGGAHTYYGAPRLTGGAAMRVGAGLVCVAAPEEIVQSIVTQVPELTVLPLVGDGERHARLIAEALDDQPGRFESFVIGPGLGRADRATALCTWACAPTNHHVQRSTIVLDADALYWLSRQADIATVLAHVKCVLTPHVGEMARLRNCAIGEVLEDPLGVALDSARAWGQIVVLKTGYSVVAAPDGRAWVAPRAMPELATAGTGDVLAGMIGGLLAQGLEPIDAARLAMYLGAMTGRAARADLGINGVVATDVIERIGPILRRLSEPLWDGNWLRSA